MPAMNGSYVRRGGRHGRGAETRAGTTLISCSRLPSAPTGFCFPVIAVERGPWYCDVAVKSWHMYTGMAVTEGLPVAASGLSRHWVSIEDLWLHNEA